MTGRAPAAELPAAAVHYRSTPSFTEQSVPPALIDDHSTKDGVWGLIRIIRGALRYHVTDVRRTATSFALEKGVDGVVEPTIRHRIELVGPVEFRVDFFRSD